MCSLNKALIITPFYKPNIGGAETFVEDLAKAISKKYIVHICTVKRTKSVVFEGQDFTQAFYLLRKMFFPLKNLVTKYKYERVYALGLMSSFLCVIFGLKFYTIIFNLFEHKSWWIMFILNKSKKVFVEGNTGKDNLESLGIKNVVSFNHWVDQTKFFYIPKNNKRLRVLFVGRPIKLKGKHIIKECERLTIGIDYEYIENVSYEKLPKYYQMADVVVVPSLYDESYSRVVTEGACCGCAIITSNKGSLPEMVFGFGIAVNPICLNFKTTLERLRDNKDGLEKIQVQTAKYALENFSEKNADCFLG